MSNRCICIADCHGRTELITNVLQHSNYNPDEDRLIFAGDFLDIGPNGRECLDILAENKAEMLCLSEDTEIFTKELGWTKYNDLALDQTIASYKDKNIIFNKIKNIQKFHYIGDMINIIGRCQDQLVTPDHAVCYLTRESKKVRYLPAKTMVGKKVNILIPAAAKIIREYADISDAMIAVCGLVITEGTYLQRGGIQIYQYNDTSQPIRSVLNYAGIKWSEYRGHNERERVFYISKKDSDEIKKYLPSKLDISWFLNNLSCEQMRILHKYLIYGDGSERDNGGTFYTNNIILADQFQLLSIFCGYKSCVKERIRDIFGYKNVVCYEVYYVKTHIKGIHTKRIKLIPYDGIVFDITTEEGNFLARRNGKTFFTGNCGNHELSIILHHPVGPQHADSWLLFGRLLRMRAQGKLKIAAVHDNVLITHAGLSSVYYMKYKDWPLIDIAEDLNIQSDNSIKDAQILEQYWNDSSPVWYRPGNIEPYPDIIQVCGHTPVSYVRKYFSKFDLKNFYMIDPYTPTNFESKDRYRYATIERGGKVTIYDSNNKRRS